MDRSSSDAIHATQRKVMYLRLWERLSAMYGKAWSGPMGSTPLGEDEAYTVAGETWALGMRYLSGKQIALGLEKCMASGSPYPPKLPEFVVLCMDLPSPEEVQPYLLGRAAPTQFALLVARKMEPYGGSWAFRHATTERAERMLRNAYEVAKGEVMLGKPLPAIPVGIEQDKPERKPASPETVAVARAKLAEVLNLNPDLTPVEPDGDTQEPSHE